jgi:hypothetical protein
MQHNVARRLRIVLIAAVAICVVSSRRANAQVDAGHVVDTVITNPSQLSAALRAELVASPVVAIGREGPHFEECSAMGGLHAIVDVVRVARGAGVHRVHLGGHDVSSIPGLSPSTHRAGSSSPASARWYVLGLAAATSRPSPRGWCIDDMPTADARMLVMIPVASQAVAEAIVATLPSR